MQQLVAVVLVLDDVIDVIGRLLGGLNVLAGARGEADVFVVGRKHPHQVRHDRLNRVREFGGDDGRATLHLVAQRLTKVEVQRAQAILRVFAVEMVQRVSDLATDNRTKLYVVHLSHYFAFFFAAFLGAAATFFSPFIRTFPLVVLTFFSIGSLGGVGAGGILPIMQRLIVAHRRGCAQLLQGVMLLTSPSSFSWQFSPQP